MNMTIDISIYDTFLILISQRSGVKTFKASFSIQITIIIMYHHHLETPSIAGLPQSATAQTVVGSRPC